MKPDIKKRVIHRLKITEGQIKGLQKMVEEEKYCIDIITQSLAIKKALSGIEDLMMENHLGTHVLEQINSGNKNKAIKEIVSVYKLSKNK
jgi:DNA-binding FrmR family transcriptional regulator